MIGDNLFAVMLVSRTDLLCFLGIFVLCAVLSVYINMAVYSRYPEKLTKLSFAKIILEMHIPLFDLIQAVRYYISGKENWSGMRDGRREYFRD